MRPSGKLTIPQAAVLVIIAAMPFYFAFYHPSHTISPRKAYQLMADYKYAEHRRSLEPQANRILLTTRYPQLMTAITWRGVVYSWR